MMAMPKVDRVTNEHGKEIWCITLAGKVVEKFDGVNGEERAKEYFKANYCEAEAKPIEKGKVKK